MLNSNRSHPPSTLHRRLLGVVAVLVALLTLTPGIVAADSATDADAVVVANRGSGDISVIDTSDLSVTTYPLPGESAEPMYVSHDSRHGRVLVGDRASSTIVAFDNETYEVVGSVDVGDGIFHQWIDVNRERLWVVGTTNATVSVVDTSDLSLVTTFALPTDVIAQGGVPHDVVVSRNLAFVSVVGLDGGDGLVIQYETDGYTETGRIGTGGDPHLFVRANKLYVASQEAGTVERYRARSLQPLGSASVPAAHGLFVSDRNEVFVTNIAGGGSDAVWELNRRLTSVTAVTDTDVPVPHNLAIDDDRQLWVTHSGATADRVSVIDLTRKGFGDVTTVTVGLNPFGLAFVG